MVQTYMPRFHIPSLELHHSECLPQNDEPVVEETLIEKLASAQKDQPKKCEYSCENHCALLGGVCPFDARMASLYASSEVKALRENSKIFSPDEKPNFLELEPKDVKIYEWLGSGGYSKVNRCLVKAGPEANKEFAIKYLKQKTMLKKRKFMLGAADLAMEAHFLDKLDHPNIVKLHGITAGPLANNVAKGTECGFFIIVDRLHETLENKIAAWNHENDRQVLGVRRLARREAKKRKEIRERCEMALSIANAMAYLHSLGIVYRDLKPDNIGFDKQGNLKLFDFGLAKEMKDNLKAPLGRYQLTGKTGSRRYMAPEVALKTPYDQSVDVYSFGILLWEMLTTALPFDGYDERQHLFEVHLGGERPPMDESHTRYWPLGLQWLVKKCWSTDPSNRPDFAIVQRVLFDILDSSHIRDEVPTEGATKTDAKKGTSRRLTAVDDDDGDDEKHEQTHTSILACIRPYRGGRRHSNAATGENLSHIDAPTTTTTTGTATSTSTSDDSAGRVVPRLTSPTTKRRGRSQSWGLLQWRRQQC